MAIPTSGRCLPPHLLCPTTVAASRHLPGPRWVVASRHGTLPMAGQTIEVPMPGRAIGRGAHRDRDKSRDENRGKGESKKE